MDKKVLLLGCDGQVTRLRAGAGRAFVPVSVESVGEALAHRSGAVAAVVGQTAEGSTAVCQALIAANLPVLLFVQRSGQQLEDLLAGMDVGCADVLDDSMSVDEWWRRIELVIMHRIANEQLQTQLRLARAVASTAMRASTDLSVSLKFMVDAAACSSVDELGLRLFQVLRHFGLDCSLQIRSESSIKNMEGNGMPRELEARLLHDLRDTGRYIEFGRRIIINHGVASLLVRNMPIEDADRYAQLKDALTSLVQGLEGRARALGALQSLSEEQSARQLLDRVARQLRQVVLDVEDASYDAVKQCADVVEGLALALERELGRSHLGHQEEERILGLLEAAVVKVNQQFLDRLRWDEQISHVLAELELPLASLSRLMPSSVEGRVATPS